MAAATGAALFIAAGLWVSLHYSLAAWKADSDTFVPVQLWEGVRAHGLTFLATWGYTQDNWLLSLTPLTSLAYAVFGATPRVAVLTGWVAFLVAIGLTSALVWRLAGRWAALLTAGTLLFANYYATGPVGYLSYPISHNVSMAWGALVVLIVVFSLERGSYLLAVVAALLLFVAAVSDPWAGAAVGVPLALTAGAIWLLDRRSRTGRSAVVLAAASIFAVWVAYRHPFGLLDFLRRGDFPRGGLHVAIDNFKLAYRALTLTYNIVPGGNLEAAGTKAISCAALAGVLLLSAGLAIAQLKRADPARRLVTGVAILSLGAVSVLYLAGGPNSGLYVARFFPNIYAFGAALAAIGLSAPWPRWRLALRIVLAAYAALFVASGAAATPKMWQAPLAASNPPEATALGRALQAHGLAYGYGAYWGSQALAMPALTGGAVTIRPVVLRGGRIARRLAETSSLWFAPGAEPPGATPFLALTPDLEGCPSAAACEAVARGQFGEPSQRFVLGNAVVLAWRRPLAPAIAP